MVEAHSEPRTSASASCVARRAERRIARANGFCVLRIGEREAACACLVDAPCIVDPTPKPQKIDLYKKEFLLIMWQVVGKPQFVISIPCKLIPLFHFDTGRNFCQILPIGRSIAVDAIARSLAWTHVGSGISGDVPGSGFVGIASGDAGWHCAVRHRRCLPSAGLAASGAPAQRWAGGIGLAARKRLVLGHDVRGCGFWAGLPGAAPCAAGRSHEMSVILTEASPFAPLAPLAPPAAWARPLAPRLPSIIFGSHLKAGCRQRRRRRRRIAPTAAPHAAVPMVPPRPRKNSAIDVALPMLCGSAPVCAAMFPSGMLMPMPKPSTADETAICAKFVSAPMMPSASEPAPMTIKAMRASVRMRPVLPNSLPEVLLPIIRASVIGIVA